MNWLYLVLNLGSVAIPFAFSFDKRIDFAGKWKFLFPSLFSVAAFFLIWDVWFTKTGVWEFNSKYVLGINIVNLPLEEWLFFILIPYACVFIYEALKYYLPHAPFQKAGNKIAIVLAITFLLTAVFHYNHVYTFVTFTLLSLFLFINVFVLHSAFLSRFFFSYMVSLIPFLIVNGVLTGMPVLIYNDAENCGFRIGTIPVEDFFYSMLLLLMNITVYEHLMQRYKKRNLS
ncbi:MAG TPA: lycopene cyclase domain-containing protein [Bacteroidia bacterium]|nr:lycopene cyclase domain-containing protein [Bacteroidia bacterium]